MPNKPTRPRRQQQAAEGTSRRTSRTCSGEVPGSGCLLIGDKGKIFSPDDYGEQFFVKLNGEKKFTHYKKHPARGRHPADAFRATRSRATTTCGIIWNGSPPSRTDKPELCYSRFAIGAQLTEIMLLGCVSLRAGQKIEWDGPTMRATNDPAAAQFVKRDNRAPWHLS